MEEARQMIQEPDFKGYIHDVGGPTADFRHPACEKQLRSGACPERQCLFPRPCPNLKADHGEYIRLLRKLRALPGVRKVFIRAGIRFDYVDTPLTEAQASLVAEIRRQLTLWEPDAMLDDLRIVRAESGDYQIEVVISL